MLIMMASCTQNLDLKPESEIVAGSFSSAQDAENLLTGAYGKMAGNGYFQYNRFYVTEGINDNHYVNGDNPQEMSLENFSFGPNTVPIKDSYGDVWTQISAANAVLDNVSLINDPKWEGTTRKEQILAEAKFLRALNYYELVTQFGGVPVILSQLNDGNTYPTRNTKEEVYAQIISDLKFAESNLSAAPYKNEGGRATQGAAQALLAKTYAQMLDYTNCLAYANKVINSKTYALVDDYSKLWGMDNKNNKESIFQVQQGGGSGWWSFQIFAYATGDHWPKRNIGSADLVRAFETAGDKGARYTSTFNWQIPNASFNMPVNAWDVSKPIPFIGKYAPNGWNSQDNIQLLRLADVILLAAEASNQLGNAADAIAKLNQIRKRAGLGNTTATTKSDLGLAILNERRLEFVFESNRWNDLKRADANGYIKVVDVMNNQKDGNNKSLGYSMKADKYQLTFPIPQQDIYLNPKLTQNPGY